MTSRNNGKRYLVIGIALLLAGVSLRMIRIDREFLGNFGQRQVYEAWLSRDYIRGGIDIFNPKMDALDYQGKKTRVFRDPPLVNAAVAYCSMKLGGSIELWGRFLSVIFYAGTFAALFFWLRFYFSITSVITILFVFTFLPISIIYSQSFILEPSALFLFTMGMLLLEWTLRGNGSWRFPLSGFFLGLAFASRTQYIAFAVALIYLFYRYRGQRLFRDKWLYITLLISLSIPILWQLSMWKLAAANMTKSSFDVTLSLYYPSLSDYLNPEIYRKIFDDFTTIILNPIGFSMALLGLLLWDWKRNNLFFPVLLFSMLPAVILMPQKFYRHDYYYFPMILPLSVLAGYAIERIAGFFLGSYRYIKIILLLVFLAASLRYSVNPAFKTPDWQKPYIKQAGVVRSAVAPGEKIVIMGADSTFLYYCDRQGWLMGTEDAPAKGAAYIYSEEQMPEDRIELLKHYEGLGARFVIVYKKDGVSIGRHFEEYIYGNYSLLKETDFLKIFQRKS